MAQFQDMMCCGEPMDYHESNEVNYFHCPTCEESIRTDEFDAQSTVKTMSGKPHTPRELIADKDITPQEAMHRKMMSAESSGYEQCWEKMFWHFSKEGNQDMMDLMVDIENECLGTMKAEMDDSSFREEVTEIAWGDMTDRQPFDDEETIDKLYEYSMKAYAFDEGLSNEDLQIIWKGAEGESHYTKTWKDIMEADDKYPITRGIFWGGVVGLTLPWVIDQIKSRMEGA